MDPLTDFSHFEFEHEGKRRNVYRKGTGPAVIVIHEIPGITPQVARFARYVVDAGMTAFMPHLFGVPGKPVSRAYATIEMARACIGREFRMLAENGSSPIVDWLRALAGRAYEIGGKGVGAVGMCLTGNFALTMMLDRFLIAPVLSQPSLPLPLTGRKAAAVHASPEALANVRRRHAEEGLTVLGLRFAGDPICRRERFDTLPRELGGAFQGTECAARHAHT